MTLPFPLAMTRAVKALAATALVVLASIAPAHAGKLSDLRDSVTSEARLVPARAAAAPPAIRARRVAGARCAAAKRCALCSSIVWDSSRAGGVGRWPENSSFAMMLRWTSLEPP